MTQARDSHGRFKADHRTRKIAIGATAAIGAVAAGIAAALHFGKLGATDGGEHAAPDLAPDAPTPGADGRRAPVAFRPDPTAIPSRSEYDSLRPATGPSPSIVADRGELAGQAAPANA